MESGDYNFYPGTKGFYLLSKKCLTDKDSYLLPLYNYMSGCKTIESAIAHATEGHDIDKSELQNFMDSVLNYKSMHNAALDTRNMWVSNKKRFLYSSNMEQCLLYK